MKPYITRRTSGHFWNLFPERTDVLPSASYFEDWDNFVYFIQNKAGT
jgi:hypothetical protein